MTTKNEITGDLLISRPSTKYYDENYDRIFGKTKAVKKDWVKLGLSPSTVVEEWVDGKKV